MTDSTVRSSGEDHVFETGPVQFECGDTLPSVRIGYQIHGRINAARDNLVLLMPGSSHDRTGILGHVGPGAAFDPERFCIVTTDALGLGLSSKPSDGLQGGFARYAVRDLVRLQQQLMREVFGSGDTPLAAVGGTSMGAFQALEWIVSEPTSARAAVLMVPADRAGQVIRSASQRMREMLALDPNWQEGRCLQPPLEGLRLVGRHYQAWAASDDYIESRGEDFEREARAAGDRFAQLGAWDVIRRYECSSTFDIAEAFGGRLDFALARVSARVLLLPCRQDRLLGIERARLLAAGLTHARCIEIDSPLGHLAWRPVPGSPQTDVITRAVRDFLA